MSARWIALLLLLLLLQQRSAGGATWGSFARDNCIKPGLRKYYSRLWDISGDWTSACESTPATVAGVFFVRPDNCVDKGIGGMWGEFYVRDTSCDPKWGSFKEDGCIGNGLLKYSSVLWDIQGSWEDWCSLTPARVRGIYFPNPTRCVNTGLNMWGEFYVVDPCCAYDDSGVTPPPDRELRTIWSGGSCDGGHDPVNPDSISNLSHAIQALGTCVVPLQAPGATSRNDPAGSCGDDDDSPPFPNPGTLSNVAQAIQALASGVNPFRLAGYLWGAIYRVLVSDTSVQVSDYYALQSNSMNPPILSFQYSLDPGVPYTQIQALLIPTTPGRLIVNAGGSFPSGTFVTVDVANPAAPVLCTAQLTGCCLAFGWDNSNGRFYMGHAQPDSEIPQISNRANIANYLRMNGAFQGVELSRDNVYFFGGDDDLWGYADATANVIGFVSDNCVYIVVQIIRTVGIEREIVRGWMMMYYRQ